MEKEWSEPPEGTGKSSPVRDALRAVNPVVGALYVLHMAALVVLAVAAIVETGSLFIPMIGVAILTGIELVVVKNYLDARETVLAARADRQTYEKTAGGTQRRSVPGPYQRATSGSDDE